MFNPENGKLDTARAFDTHESSKGFEEFISKCEIPDGYMVVAACQDDCATKLSFKSKDWFRQLGSSEIYNLKYRQGFSFIGIKGSRTAYEKRGAGKPADV